MRSFVKMLRWMCFMVTVAVVSCELQELLSSRGLSKNELNIEEITQIMNDEDPSGRNHSLRVVISEHMPLVNITEWTFLLHSTDNGAIVVYTTRGDGTNPSMQTELIFQGNLLDSDSFLLQAKNNSEDVAMSYNVLDIKVPKSQVAWVGENREEKSSSLRVKTDEQIGEIMMNHSACTPSGSPCYYINPDPKPTSFRRCVNISKDAETYIELCDERITSFKGMKDPPPISLNDDGSLELEFTFEKKLLKVEVLAYDPNDHEQVFSSFPYQCRFAVGKMWEEGEKMKCRQSLYMPDDQTEFLVLAVIVDEEGDVTESSLQYFDKTADRKLSIEKISRVLREDDPSGKNHNTKVTSSHLSLSDVHLWKLILGKNNEKATIYTADADGSNPSTQKEIIFEGNLRDSDDIALQAWNNTNSIALDYFVLDIKDMGSNVAWVGDESSSSSSSLRVITGPHFSEIKVGQQTCTRDTSPCYYITPETKPTTVERCNNFTIGTKRTVQLCDERITAFLETKPKPTVTLRDDGKLEVQFKLENKELFQVEVLAYDPEDHKNIFSKRGTSCLTPTGVDPYEGDKMLCLHDLSLPEEQKEFTVLIVKSDESGNVVSSSLVNYGSSDGSQQPDNTGAIIGAVVGTIIGVALIAFLIIFLMKKKKSASISGSTSYKYKAAEQADKQESYTGKSAEEGGESSN